MFHKLRNLFRPNRLDADLREELEFHHSQTGGSLGNVTLTMDRMRDASTIAWLETPLRDIRYGARQLSRTPVLVAVAVLSLALGIGANTAIFTLIKTVMFQLLPVPDPAQLVLFYGGISTGVYGGGNFQSDEYSYPFWQHLESHNDSFQSLAAFREGTDRVILHIPNSHNTGSDEQAEVHLVSGNYFYVLGVSAIAGRVLQPVDNSLAAPPVAVLSYRFWRDRFRLDPAILGHSVILNGTAFTVVGIADRRFFGERIQTAPDFWLPLCAQPQILHNASWRTADHVYWLNMVGRLKPGVTLAQAQSAVNLGAHQYYLHEAGTRLSPALRRKIENTGIHLTPGGGGISGLRYLYAKPLRVLMAIVAVVLLIACANVATLLLARACTRRQEFFARLALGATRARLVRQVLTESVLLSLLGGLFGMCFAWWGVKLLAVLLHVSPVVHIVPDPTVLAFTLALSVLTGIFFGIFPALKFSRLAPRLAATQEPAALGRYRFGSGHVLIVLQVALSLVLLLGAGLLAHSLLTLEHQEIGFTRDHILILQTDASLAGYQPNEFFPLYRQIEDRVSQLPGVASATISRFTPEGGNSSSGNFSLKGYTPTDSKELSLYYVPIAPRFFDTLGIPLRLGRSIGPRDTPVSPAVAVVNQTFVDRYLPGQNPLGRRISLGAPFQPPGAEIVGVVADTKYYDLRKEPQPMAFLPFSQRPAADFQIILRTTGAPTSVGGEVRQALHQISPKLPILAVTTLNAQIENSLRQQELITTLSSIFGLLALLLAAIGIYGTLAYAVAGRTAEIGIRMALGAQRRNVLWMVLRDSLLLITVGLLLGLPLALGASHWLQSFLFGIPEADPLALTAAILLILVLTLLAGYLPARRAAAIEPIRALRHE